MKTNRISFLLILSTFFLIISSCDSCKDKNDLTTEVSGIYTGTLEINDGFSINDYTGEQVQVSGLSDTKIQIQTYAGGGASSFSADITGDKDVLLLNIPEQAIAGGTIKGLALIPTDPTVHGGYNGDTHEFTYAIEVTDSSGIVYELYLGTK
jgi:hypothetical protein